MLGAHGLFMSHGRPSGSTIFRIAAIAIPVRHRTQPFWMQLSLWGGISEVHRQRFPQRGYKCCMEANPSRKLSLRNGSLELCKVMANSSRQLLVFCSSAESCRCQTLKFSLCIHQQVRRAYVKLVLPLFQKWSTWLYRCTHGLVNISRPSSTFL